MTLCLHGDDASAESAEIIEGEFTELNLKDGLFAIVNFQSTGSSCPGEGIIKDCFEAFDLYFQIHLTKHYPFNFRGPCAIKLSMHPANTCYR